MAEISQAPASTGGRTSKKLSTRVDLTAMVDLAFLLVTFFMLTTSLDKPRDLRLTMPDKTDGITGDVAASRTVTLCLGKNNQLVYYRGTIEKPINIPQVVGYDRQGLRHNLLTMAEQIKSETGKTMIVVVKPGVHAVYANIVAAIDELNITKTQIYAVTDISGKDIDLLKQKNIF